MRSNDWFFDKFDSAMDKRLDKFEANPVREFVKVWATIVLLNMLTWGVFILAIVGILSAIL